MHPIRYTGGDTTYAIKANTLCIGATFNGIKLNIIISARTQETDAGSTVVRLYD